MAIPIPGEYNVVHPVFTSQCVRGAYERRNPSRTSWARNRKLHIVSVMDYLSETTPFADLSIADICKASDISRSTFYRLFDDKFDAVNWFIYEVSRLGHTQTGRTLSWHDASFTTLSGFLIARNLLVSASKAAGYESTGETSVRLRIADLTESLRLRGVQVDDDLQYQIEYFAYSEIPAVHRWYAQSHVMSVETFARHIDSVVPRRLHDLLAMPDDPGKTVPLTIGRISALLHQREEQAL